MLRVKVYENPEKIGDDDLRLMTSRLPHDCQARANRYKVRGAAVQSLIADSLLLDLVADATGETMLPERTVAGSGGKPIFVNRPDLHFNKSHCPNAVVCAISDAPVGVDVEAVPDSLDMELCRHCFSHDEIADILADEMPTVRFAVLWTRKEALLKLEGVGLIDEMAAVADIYPSERYVFATHISAVDRYVYTICTYKCQ